MKKLIYIFICKIFSIAAVNAQDNEATFSDSKLKDINSNMQIVWNDADADFTVTATPDKWKEESGVIIAQKTKFSFDKDANKLAVFEITRRRIKLNDRDAVNTYSYFFFRLGSSKDGAGFKIIKSNGAVKEISIRNALPVEDLSDVPETFQPYIGKAKTRIDKSKSEVIFYKIAIPDLDPGDIIDYGTIFYDDNTVKKTSYIEFAPIYFICTREYPVMSQKFEIDTDDKSFVNSKAINGAPEFKDNTDGRKADYTWEDRNRERLNDTRWVNNFVDLPLVKFQIVFSKQENRGDLFIGDKGEMKRSLTPDELAKKVNSYYNKLDNEAAPFSNTIQYYLKQIDFINLREDDYINKLYNIIRHIVYFRMGGEMSSELFTYLFMKKLELKKIPCELAVSAASNITKPGNIIFRTEPEWLVKVKDKFVFNPTAVSNTFEFRENFQDAEAYIINLGKNPSTKIIKLPVTGAAENFTKTIVTATMDSVENLNLTVQKAIKGMSKKNYHYEALAYTASWDDDHRSYGGEDDLRTNLSRTELEIYDNKLRERKKEDKIKKPEYMQKVLENEYGTVVKYNEFILTSDGRSYKKPELDFTQKADIGNKVSKAGNHLLVAVPSLIESQLFINQDERIRQYDADMGFPRTMTWEINFTVPEGYKAIGVDNLASTVDNDAGYFMSMAKMEGNRVKLLVKKQYKKINVKKEEWPKMLQFLDAAYNFSQKKILLKKI
jgi:hypothetical protein